MKKTIFKNNETPITADTFNDIWNAIDCIDYRLRDVEEKNMSEYEKFKIKHISRIVIEVIFMIAVLVNAIFIRSKWLSTFLFGFIVSLLIDCIIDFIIADISSKKIQKRLDEMYQDDETYQRLFKKH